MEENIFKKGNLLLGKISGCIVECLENADLNSSLFKGVLLDESTSGIPIGYKSDNWGKKAFILYKEFKFKSQGKLFLIKNTNETIVIMITIAGNLVLQSTDKNYQIGDIVVCDYDSLEPINKHIDITFKYKEDVEIH